MTEIDPVAASEPSTGVPPERFDSVDSLRDAHTELLEQQRQHGDSPEFWARVESLIQKGQATGVLLDGLLPLVLPERDLVVEALERRALLADVQLEDRLARLHPRARRAQDARHPALDGAGEDVLVLRRHRAAGGDRRLHGPSLHDRRPDIGPLHRGLEPVEPELQDEGDGGKGDR